MQENLNILKGLPTVLENIADMKINPRHLRLSRPVPDSPARRRHANNYYVMGKGASDASCWQEAREYLDKALEYYAELQPALRELAFVYMNMNDYRQAFKYINLALDADPNDAAAHFLRGNFLLNSGDGNGALESYTKARETGEVTLELLYNIGLAHLMHNDGVAASVPFREMTIRFPESANGWDGLGCALRIAKDYPEAIAAFYRALAIDPKLDLTNEHLARTYLEAGNPRDAILVLLDVLSRNPQNEEAKIQLGLALVSYCRTEDADAGWQMLQQSGKNTPEISYQLADIYLKLKMTQKGMTVLEHIVSVYPHFVMGQLQLGLQLLQNGDNERGWQHISTAHQLDPHDATVLRMAKYARTGAPMGAPDWA